MIKLDSYKKNIVISRNQAFKGFFAKEISPMEISSIFECIAGGNVPEVDESLLLSIVGSVVNGLAPRVLVLKLNSKDERNEVINGIR